MKKPRCKLTWFAPGFAPFTSKDMEIYRKQRQKKQGAEWLEKP